MTISARDIRKSWNSVMREDWKKFSRQWDKVHHHPSSSAVHAMRSAGRRLASTVSIAALSAGRPDRRFIRKIEDATNQLGPLRDNHVYRKLLDRPSLREYSKPFTRVLERTKTSEARALRKYFRRHSKRSLHRRIQKIKRRFDRVSKAWTATEYRSSFEKVLHQRSEAWSVARQAWESEPDDKRFHRMRVELRELRYATENIAEALGLIRTRAVRTAIRTLRSLQTSMGTVHDVHKLRTELVAWTSNRRPEKRALEMAAAVELQKEYGRQLEDFKARFPAVENRLPLLQPIGKIRAEL